MEDQIVGKHVKVLNFFVNLLKILGQWCHHKTSTGAAGCGFGPPSLPYLYKTTQLLQRQQHVCLSISRSGRGLL
jgi:hypothetical protein